MMSLILQTGMSAAQFKQEKRYNCKNCNHFKGKKIMNDKNTDIQSVSIQTSKSLSIDDSICIQQQVTIQLHWIFFNNVSHTRLKQTLYLIKKKLYDLQKQTSNYYMRACNSKYIHRKQVKLCSKVDHFHGFFHKTTISVLWETRCCF